jgi:Na+/proline symporter
MFDLWIVGIYLIITLIIGIWQGRNVKTVKSYAIADRAYSTAVIVATISATSIGGGASMGVAEKAYSLGFFFFFVMMGEVLAKILISKFIAVKIEPFKGCISIGDMMGSLYGGKAQIITGIAGALLQIATLGAQVGALGQIFHYFMDVPPVIGIAIGFGIVVIYSFFGGVKAVTITDVLQFIVLIVAIPMVCNIGLSKVGGYSALFQSLPLEKTSLLPPKKELWQYIGTFLVLVMPTIGPAMAQRLLMSKDAKQASNAFKWAAFIEIPFYKMVCIIGLVSLCLAPDILPKFAMPHLIQTILPTGLKGVAIAGLLAIVMSSADSVLNSGAILLVHDVIKPLSRKDFTEQFQLNLLKVFTVVLGILSTLIALKFKSIFEIMLISRSFWEPIVFASLLSGMCGFRSYKNSFFYGCIAGAATVLVWQVGDLETKLSVNCTVPGVIINGLFFFGSHYYYKWFKPEQFDLIPNLSDRDMQIESKKKPSLSNLGFVKSCSVLSHALAKVKGFSIVNFSHAKVKEHGAPYQIFAVFTVINYIWFTDSQYTLLLATMKFIAGILCAALFFAPELIKKYNKYFSLYWHFTLIFTLPLLSFSMMLLHNGSSYWLLQTMISTFFLALLVDWISFIGITMIGLLTSCIFIKFYIGDLTFKPNSYEMTLSIYIVISSIIIGAFLSRRRENFIEQKLQTLKALGGSIAHELRTPISALSMRGVGSMQYYQKFLITYELAKKHQLPIEEFSAKEMRYINNYSKDIQDLSNAAMFLIDMLLTKLKDPAQETEKAHYSIKEIVEEAVNIYPLYDEQKELVRLNLKENFTVYGNKRLLLHIIFNLLKNALYFIQVAGKGEIIITTEVTEEANILRFKDTGQGISKEGKRRLFEKFYTSSNGGTGLGLSFCKMTMEDLGGNIRCESIYGQFTEFILTFSKS